MKNEIKLSFIIPCYNSEKTICSVVDEIEDTICNNEKYPYEVLLINDCSTDETTNIIAKLAKKSKKIRVIDLSRNFGQHSAIITGMNYATGDIVICLDDDGQTPANECMKLIREIENGHDVVYAKYEEKKHSFFRNIGSKINDLMATVLIDKPNGLYISSYFACRRYIVEEIIKYRNPYPYLQGLVLRSTKSITNVTVNHRQRENGKSGYTMRKLVSLLMNGFTAFSIKPLRLSTYIGFLLSIVGFIYGLILIVKKILNITTVAGYSSIMAAILFMGGVIMIMLGLVGEYVGRIYMSINNSPQFIIKKTINIEDGNVNKSK